MKSKEKPSIPVEIEFTEGYSERFTAAVLKICANRLYKDEVKQCNIQCQKTQVS